MLWAWMNGTTLDWVASLDGFLRMLRAAPDEAESGLVDMVRVLLKVVFELQICEEDGNGDIRGFIYTFG